MKGLAVFLGLAVVCGLVLQGAAQSPAAKEYIYVLRPARADMLKTGQTPAEQAIQGRHVEYLNQLIQKRVAILYGRTLTTDESTFGIVIFRANSEEEARNTMKNDPGVKEGLMRGTLYPYRVAWRDTRPD